MPAAGNWQNSATQCNPVRDLNDVTRKDGEAGLLWFRQVLVP